MVPFLILPFDPFTLYMNLVLEQYRWHEERKTSRIFLPPPFPGDDGYCFRQPQGSLSDTYNTVTVVTSIGHKRWPATALQTISLSSEIQCVGTILSIVRVDTKPLQLPTFCLFLAWQPPVGQGLLIHEVFLITHKDALHSVGFLWTSDQLVAETST